MKVMQNNDLLDPCRLTVKTKRIGKKILVFKSTASTNDIAAEYARNIENDGLAIFAEEQVKGRGRTGAKWQTGKYDSIICSIVLGDRNYDAELLSLTCAVAVAETIGKLADKKAKIKWPNDIIVNGKKIAGILVESRQNNDHKSYIIGIGINCHQRQDSFGKELRKIATSIDIETNSVSNRISLAKRLLTSLDHWIRLAEKNNKKIIKHWRNSSTLLNHRITLVHKGCEFTGNCIGIDPQKGLILHLDTAGPRFFDAAHTTISKSSAIKPIS